MKPLRFKNSYTLFLLALNLSLPTYAQGQTWWEKSRGNSNAGWQESQDESATTESAEKAQSLEAEENLAATEDSIELKPKSKSDEFNAEVERRKEAAAKARQAVKKNSVEDDLQSLDKEPAKEVEVAPAPTPAPKKVKKVAKRRASRGLSSLESSDDSSDVGSSETKVRTRRKAQADIFRVGILTGVASIAGTDGSTGGSLLNIALQANYQSKYWGMELDGYYGLGLGLSASGSSASGMSQSQYGFFVGPKVNYTFGNGSFRFTPKAGVGYGMLAMSMSATTSSAGTSTQVTSKNSFSGIYAMGGFDMFLTRWLFLDADYATSVSASATAEASQNNVSYSGKIEGAKFQRIRVGLNFLISQHLILGAQYYSRSISVQGVSAPQNFIMGHLGYQF